MARRLTEIADGRRRSTYFIWISAPGTKGGAQLSLPGVKAGERMTGDSMNRVSEHVRAFWGE